MILRKEIRKKLIAGKLDEVFECFGQALDVGSEGAKTLLQLQASFNRLRADFQKNIIFRNEYDVNYAKITNTLVELLQDLPEERNDRRGVLRSLIKELDFEKDRIGQLYMVNCNRRKLADLFWDRFDEKVEQPYQYYFIPASPSQMPPSFAERMICEVLNEELDKEVGAISRELKEKRLRLKAADFTIKNNLARTIKAFKKYFCKRFEEPDFDKLINQVLPERGFKFVATLIMIELDEWKPFMPDFLEWVLEIFRKVEAQSRTSFLFFNVIYLDNYVDDPIDEEQKNILTSLRSIIARNEATCTVIKGFTPVPLSDLKYWFRDIGEHNPNRISAVIDRMVSFLPAKKQKQFSQMAVLDMVDIEDLQLLVYELANE